MALKNPYTMKGMLPIDSEMFFGREKEMRRIEDMLTGVTPQCVSIIGERRIGKSSLAWRVFHKVKKEENTLAVFLDCGGLAEECKSKEQFFQRLNKCFLEDNPGVEEPGKSFFEDYSTFKNFTRSSGRKGKKTIIFLDEFEHLPDNGFADDTFFSNLRSMANNPKNLSAFVTISKTPLKELTHDSIQASTFWNIFNNKIIGLLDHRDITELRRCGFTRKKFSLTGEETGKIHYYANDFAFFNQVVCAFIWDAKMDGDDLDWDRLETEIYEYYEKMWQGRSKEEQKLLKSLKSKDNNILLKEIRTRGIVRKEKEYYLPFSDYFSHLIKDTLEIERESFGDKAGKVLDTALKVKKVMK